MEREDFSAFLSVFAQTVNSVRPSGNSERVDFVGIFDISDGEVIRRSHGILVYRIIEPGL